MSGIEAVLEGSIFVQVLLIGSLDLLEVNDGHISEELDQRFEASIAERSNPAGRGVRGAQGPQYECAMTFDDPINRNPDGLRFTNSSCTQRKVSVKGEGGDTSDEPVSRPEANFMHFSKRAIPLIAMMYGVSAGLSGGMEPSKSCPYEV